MFSNQKSATAMRVLAIIATVGAAAVSGHESGNVNENENGSGSSGKDCYAQCDDQWWACNSESWQRCSYEKVMQQYPTPIDYGCVQGLLGDGQTQSQETSYSLLSCLRDAGCFEQGKDWCEAWKCDVDSCNRWTLCYSHEEDRCNQRWNGCFDACEQQNQNEEPDCVEAQCRDQIEACVNEATCAALVQQIEPQQLCEPDNNGGESCFERGYQQMLCSSFYSYQGQNLGSDSASEECALVFGELAACYEEKCFQEEQRQEQDNSYADSHLESHSDSDVASSATSYRKRQFLRNIGRPRHYQNQNQYQNANANQASRKFSLMGSRSHSQSNSNSQPQSQWRSQAAPRQQLKQRRRGLGPNPRKTHAHALS